LVKEYVKDRRSGKIKSDVDEKCDLTSLCLENDYFTDSMITDEIVDFMNGGTLTS